MRLSALTLIGALGLAVSSVSASAAPAAPALDIQRGANANIVQVAGGCGWGLHPNRWGRCVPNGYGYARPRPYYGGRYYGGGWYGDRSAGQLNRYELGRNYYGGFYR